MKNTTKLTALITAAGIIAGTALMPMDVSAELGAVPGQVDDIYDPAYGTGLGDVVMVLEHYAMTAAGLVGPLNDIYERVGAEVTGDDLINLDDACAMLNLYSAYAAGLNIDIYDYFGIYNAYDDALDKYKAITAEFLEDYSGADPAYDLVNIDNNLIPELVLSPSTTHASGGCTIYTYVDGEVINLGEGFGYCGQVKFCYTDYDSPYKYGYILNDNGYTGYRWVNVYALERGKLTEKHYLTMDYNYNEFTIDGAAATEAVCEAFLDTYCYLQTQRSYTSISDYWS